MEYGQEELMATWTGRGKASLTFKKKENPTSSTEEHTAVTKQKLDTDLDMLAQKKIRVTEQSHAELNSRNMKVK